MTEFEDYLGELSDASVQLKVSALTDLSDLTPEQAERFGQAWPGIDVRRRRRVVQELLDLEEDNVELNFDAVFLRGLEDEDTNVRLESIRGLWEYEKPDLIGPLVRLMEEDESARVRAEAALALGRFVVLSAEGRLRARYFQQVESGLRRVLEHQNEVQEVRARALESIGPYDEAWVRQAIREAYESGALRLKVSAVNAMGRSCEARWLPLVVRELLSEEAELRFEAAVACGSIDDERAVPHLLPLLSDTDGEAQRAAIAALGEIGGPEAKSALRELASGQSPSAREAALAALAEIDFGDDPLSFTSRT